MKKIVIGFILALVLTTPSLAQKNVMVLENPGNKKSFKYYEGDKIEFRTTDSLLVKGLISSIKDTTFILDFYTEMSVRKVMEVQRNRWGVNILSKLLMVGGVGLIALETINGAVSSSGNININTLYIGAGAAGAGALLIPLQKSHHRIGPDQWKLKILPMEGQFNYQKNKTIGF